MKLISILCFLLIVVSRVQRMEGKLQLGHSTKSSEILSNTIYDNNNAITEALEGEPTKDPKQQQQQIQKGEESNPNDVGQENKMQFNVKKANNAAIERNIKNAQLVKEIKKNLLNETKKIPSITISPTTTTSLSGKSSASSTKIQQANSFINPFGQLSSFLGGDQLHYLQDYNFLFNAERHTIFQLYTSMRATKTVGGTITTTTNSLDGARVLHVVSGTLGAAFGVSPTSTTAGDSSIRIEEVQLYNAASLRQSHFNPFNPTRILIHGWFGGAHAGIYNTLIPEYLKLSNGSYNVFTVDWGRGAVADYITASYRVKPVGKVVAKFIDFLHRESGMRFEDLHVIGFSMGAHIAGIAGKFIQTGRLPIIYALDPALPLFHHENIAERMALTDADFVEVIHTSAGSYGYDRPIGHVDFYVNFGSNQPGCFLNECSHFRAFQVFAESLRFPERFRGQGCDVKLWMDLIKNRRCLMGTGRNLTMGGDPTNAVELRKRGGGVYYFTTNASPPFGKM